MARARNIKPSFFKNENLAECAPLARLLFSGLWTIADREGRLEDRPKKIKVEVLPYDECNIEELLAQLVEHKFIRRYEVAGEKYIQILTFTEHQKPHQNEQVSTIPPEALTANSEQGTTKVTSTSNQGDCNSGLNPHPLTPILKPPPLSPPGVLKNGNGKGVFHVEHHLSDDAIQVARAEAPGWDLHHLMRVYDEGVPVRGVPKDPDKAFPVWCAKYTKGKRA